MKTADEMYELSKETSSPIVTEELESIYNKMLLASMEGKFQVTLAIHFVPHPHTIYLLTNKYKFNVESGYCCFIISWDKPELREELLK